MVQERFIDANKIRLTATASMDESGEVLVSLRDVIKAIDQTPTADVVPRCEEERYIPLDSDDAINRVFAHYKKTVVREITDELLTAIEAMRRQYALVAHEAPHYGYDHHELKGVERGLRHAISTIKEVKGKYTEE